jgi:carboxypeptidase Q
MKIRLLLCTLFVSASGFGQDSLVLSRISDNILLEGTCYENLRVLCKTVGHRLSGSPQAAMAVNWGLETLKAAGADSVWLQPVEVPKWVRGEEALQLQLGKDTSFITVPALSVGNAVGTDGKVLEAPIIMVPDFETLEQLRGEEVKGKIVFFNYRFRQELVNTLHGYSDATQYRWNSANYASAKGALAVIVRSVSTGLDDLPHTGTLRYDENLRPIPSMTIGNSTADRLEAACRKQTVLARMRSTCRMEGAVLSHNVIGEVRGTTYPDEIIVAGGHLDSWDQGEGAHDDGAGCVQAIEIIRTFKALNIQPKRTVRVVLFMNEENGLKGGGAYADSAVARKEKHIFALESDLGGFPPRGFSLGMTEEQKQRLRTYAPLLFPYGVYDFTQNGGGADIGPLQRMGVPAAGLLPDGQRYFDLHHTDQDVFETVNHRELKLGAIAMTALVYLISEHGF